LNRLQSTLYLSADQYKFFLFWKLAQLFLSDNQDAGWNPVNDTGAVLRFLYMKRLQWVHQVLCQQKLLFIALCSDQHNCKVQCRPAMAEACK